MDSSYATPLRTPRSRRKALSPAQKSVYSSPYETVELAETDEVKQRLLEQDGLIQELRGTVEELQSAMGDRLDDSILIETSNKISIQEKRVFQRDVDMLMKEIDRKQEENKSIRKEKEDQITLRQATELKLSKARSEVDGLNMKIFDLQEKITDLETELAKCESEKTTVRKGECCRDAKETINELKWKTEKYKSLLEEEQREHEEAREKLTSLEKTLEECRKRELELQVRVRSQEEARKSIENALAFKEIDSSQVLREIQTLSTHIISIPQAKLPDLSLIEQIGSLKTTIEFKEKRIEELLEKERETMQHFEEEKSKLSAAESEIRGLHKQLVEFEGDKEAANSYLIGEIDKVKQQKADIRAELIKLQKEHKKTEEKLNEMDRESDAVRQMKEELVHAKTDIQALKIENTVQKEKIESLQEALAKAEQKIKDKQDELVRSLSDSGEKQELKRLVDVLEARIAEMRPVMVMLDEQCEKYRELKQQAEAGRKRALDEVTEITEKLRSSERQQEHVRASEAEISQLKVDKERLEDKCRYLKEELQEAHSDYRDELARMAREISESKRRERDANEGGDHSILIADLKQKVKTHDSEARSLKRQLEELKKDNEKLQAQVAEVLSREKSVVAENSSLRQGVADAVAKLEQYRRDLADQREMNQGMAEKLGESEEKLNKAKDELGEMEDALAEKESLIGYLQSQINVKQLPKVSRRSTLLTSVSESSISSGTVEVADQREVEEVMKLESELQQLKKERDEKKLMLSEKRNPLPSAPPRTPLRATNSTEFKVPAPRQTATLQKATGTMRHDIPHKWKDVLRLSVFSAKCAVCFVGVPIIGKARTCSHCGVVVHTACSRRVVNTCGLPDQCANFYLESHTAPVGRMNGWIRIFRDDSGSRSWESCWALMDDRNISFYDQESVNGDLSKPFFKIDLAMESFVVRAGCSAPENAEKCSQAASIIHIKLSKLNLYVLAPSIQSAKRWTEALQTAQTKKMMLTRKPSSFSEQSCLLTLNAPNNLTIHTTTVIDDCLLIGAKGGLFFTHLHSPRMPIRFGGVHCVLAMEVIPEINTVALITGPQKNLAMIPLSTLKGQLACSQPSVRMDVIGGLSHLHLLAYHQQAGQKYLIAADALKLYILKYHPNRDVFGHFHTIDTNEPTMCLQSTPSGFYFGADSFYRIDFSSSTPSVVSLVPAHVADYPIAILSLGGDELLLAYQNYGLFVNARGTRTRDQVEWEQMPMEFVFTAPYLYVIHYDSIEIMQIAENLGQQPVKTILEEREVFSCQNAHVVGTRTNGDIYVSISSKESTEVHKFNATQSRRTMKRKGISLSHFSEKRSKVAV